VSQDQRLLAILRTQWVILAALDAWLSRRADGLGLAFAGLGRFG
jgi:hypothetical protein